MTEQNNPLLAISPLDGRYYSKMDALRPLFSEFALIRGRVQVELGWLCLLGEHLVLTDPDSLSKLQHLADHINHHFSLADAEAIKAIEATTKHDVKAVEYWLAEQLDKAELGFLRAWVHFACTSEDINNLAYGIMLLQCQNHLLSRASELYQELDTMANENAGVPMLSRTHGQAASPTTLGKECRNIASRLKQAHAHFSDQGCYGKCNGAVGNYNAHVAAYPSVDWPKLSREFVESLGLIWQAHSTQIEAHDGIGSWSHALSRLNTVLIDASRDIWQYISNGYFTQSSVSSEVGSSTMPHKTNPIDFENAEGNLGIANALAHHMACKLPVSRLQRDLSDSTVLRNIGVMIGHSDLAYQALLKGLKKLSPNTKKLKEECDGHWEVLAEAVQTVMRANGIADAYEQLKAVTRGQAIDENTLKEFIDNLDIPGDQKESLLELTPSTYLGLAEFLAKQS